MMRRDQRGATAVVVAVSLSAVLGAAVLSIDSGSVWRTRRNLVTDTDAAALAAARSLDAQGAKACDATATANARSEAAGLIAANDPDSVMEGFTVKPTGGNCSAESGQVRVDGRLVAQLSFAGVFGIGSVDVASSSIAQWGPLAAATGLRPIGICDKSPHFQEWADHLAGNDAGWDTPPQTHPNYPGGAVVHRIHLQRGSSGCGSASGNWDWLDFNGNHEPNGNSALREWFYNGFPDQVSLGDAATGRVKDCNPNETGAQDGCDPKTGAGGGSFIDSLEYLRDSKITFPIMVYDKVVDRRDPAGCSAPPPWNGSGSNARFCHVAFLLVRIHGWDQITGNLGDNSYLDLEFVDEWWVGSIGQEPSGGRPTVHGVALCGGGYGTKIDNTCDV
ncbi:MAG TPA: pilus assembly protein TadG-related protein [Actinomycetota bacterium]|nr:pilus assembly protein TadG-related protein [Actinomycetota bacterium]